MKGPQGTARRDDAGKDPLRNCAGNWKHCGLTALPSIPSVAGNGADVTGQRARSDDAPFFWLRRKLSLGFR